MKCPECNKQIGYVRIGTKEWVCRACGVISKYVYTEKVNRDEINQTTN
jgi:ribosomal protein L37AE/L43A